MSDDQTLATQQVTDTGTGDVQNQATERVYTQKEVDDMMAKTRAAVERKALRPYQDLGSPDELRSIKEQFENKRFEEHKGKGDFETILKEMASKKDAEIAKRDTIIANYRVDTPLLEIAAKHRAVAPEQVKSLLKNQVRLTQDGEVEVIDSNGTTRYKDNGEPMGVEDLVKTFLDTNPWFVAAGPATTQTSNSVMANSPKQIDITKLDMKKPSDRKIYAEWRASQAR